MGSLSSIHLPMVGVLLITGSLIMVFLASDQQALGIKLYHRCSRVSIFFT
jgi:hypothetical protein